MWISFCWQPKAKKGVVNCLKSSLTVPLPAPMSSCRLQPQGLRDWPCELLWHRLEKPCVYPPLLLLDSCRRHPWWVTKDETRVTEHKRPSYLVRKLPKDYIATSVVPAVPVKSGATTCPPERQGPSFQHFLSCLTEGRCSINVCWACTEKPCPFEQVPNQRNFAETLVLGKQGTASQTAQVTRTHQASFPRAPDSHSLDHTRLSP